MFMSPKVFILKKIFLKRKEEYINILNFAYVDYIEINSTIK